MVWCGGGADARMEVAKPSEAGHRDGSCAIGITLCREDYPDTKYYHEYTTITMRNVYQVHGMHATTVASHQ